MQPFFSIIIPAYNAAERICKGLDSIKNQTFTDYELIIICDDCQDNTAEIAHQYTNKVFEVNFHNCGKTRNIGLDNAIGKWILFMDDDDWWIDNNVLQILFDNLTNSNEDFDVLAFDFILGKLRYAKQTPSHLYIAVWNKAWKKSFVDNIRFPEIPYGDDVRFHKYAVEHAKFHFLNKALYYYNYLRPGSISEQIEKGLLPPLE